MCGLVGRFDFDQLKLGDRDVLAAMTDAAALTMLELWFREFVDCAPASPARYAEAI